MTHKPARHPRALLLAATILAAGAVSMPALAQTASPDAPAAGASGDAV